jgi:Phage terminase large subunit (GpA)
VSHKYFFSNAAKMVLFASRGRQCRIILPGRSRRSLRRKRSVSPQTHGRLFQANVSHYKLQLADKLRIEPGSIHFGSEDRGFDQEFSLQLLSEHKETELSREVRTVVWKRIRDRNEAPDLIVMILCLRDIFRPQIDRMAEPQIAQENG